MDMIIVYKIHKWHHRSPKASTCHALKVNQSLLKSPLKIEIKLSDAKSTKVLAVTDADHRILPACVCKAAAAHGENRSLSPKL